MGRQDHHKIGAIIALAWAGFLLGLMCGMSAEHWAQQQADEAQPPCTQQQENDR